MKLHSFCLISGEGGIGKSYFIKCFEEQLEQKILSICVYYGKFEKNTNNIDVEEIISASHAGFIVEDDSLTSDIEFLKIVLAEYGIADDFDMLEEEDIL